MNKRYEMRFDINNLHLIACNDMKERNYTLVPFDVSFNGVGCYCIGEQPKRNSLIRMYDNFIYNVQWKKKLSDNVYKIGFKFIHDSLGLSNNSIFNNKVLEHG
jgi:hypothetical protein